LNVSSEPPLPEELKWPLCSNWHAALAQSPLANHIAVHLFLYNDWEIVYIRRGQVDQVPSLWNSTVNGVMEFKEDNPDLIDGKPDIGTTAKRESLYELNVEINPKEIRWMGIGATLDRCEPFVVGVCRIPDRLEQLAKNALLGREQREISEGNKGFRRKAMRAIPTRSELRKEDINLGVVSISLPIRVRLSAKPESIIREKVIKRQELPVFATVLPRTIRSCFSRVHLLPKTQMWSDGGSASLLLCLAHLYSSDKLQRVLMKLKNEHDKDGSSRTSQVADPPPGFSHT